MDFSVHNTIDKDEWILRSPQNLSLLSLIYDVMSIIAAMVNMSVGLTYLATEPHCMTDYTRHSDIDRRQV